MSTLTRSPITVSRDLEFFSEPELTKQLGYSRHLWPLVLTAELIDNALDHAEEVKRQPFITVEASENGITVRDNGTGMPESVIAGLLDFSSRTSSRVCYRTPTRGSQGNAGKCLVALPYVWSGGTAGNVDITVGNKTHRITSRVDPLTRSPVVDREIIHFDAFHDDNLARSTNGSECQIVHSGTAISVDLPSISPNHIAAIRNLMCRYAILNPHAAFELNGESWESSSPKFRKWSAARPDPVDWYTFEAFRERAAMSADQDRKAGGSRTVREFITEFSGFRRSDVCAATLAAAKLGRVSLLEVASDQRKSRLLYQAMKDQSEPPKPDALGIIGRQTLEATIGSDGFRYKKVDGKTEDGLPFVIEAAFADSDGRRSVVSGINFSPDVYQTAIRSLPELLQEFRVEDSHGCMVVLHLTTPSPQFTSRGKTEVTLDSMVSDAVDQAVAHVCAEHHKRIKAMERDADRFAKDVSRANLTATVSLKAAIFHYLPESIKHMSGDGKYPFDARSHYYHLRPLVQKMAGRQLSQKRLDDVIDEWESEHGIIELRHRDPRGFMLQPHDGRRIPLGTRAVNDYKIPELLFHNLLFIEKKGLLSILEAHDIPNKYDLAIVAAEGFSTRAAQMLMQSAARGHSMKVVVLHDADPAGYMIANKLGQSSGAHKFDYEVVDAGLFLDEALAMELEPEEFIRTQSLSDDIEWTETDLEYFGGTPTTYTKQNGSQGTKWVAKRVELNALAADPPKFVAWVEGKLHNAGVARKLVPPEEVVSEFAREYYAAELASLVESAVMSRVDLAAIIEGVAAEHPWKDVPIPMDNWARAVRPEGWRVPVEFVVRRFLKFRRAQVDDLVDDLLSDSL